MNVVVRLERRHTAQVWVAQDRRQKSLGHGPERRRHPHQVDRSDPFGNALAVHHEHVKGLDGLRFDVRREQGADGDVRDPRVLDKDLQRPQSGKQSQAIAFQPIAISQEHLALDVVDRPAENHPRLSVRHRHSAHVSPPARRSGRPPLRRLDLIRIRLAIKTVEHPVETYAALKKGFRPTQEQHPAGSQRLAELLQELSSRIG